MPTGNFRVTLAVNPTGGGDAELNAPDALQEVDFQYLIVKEGGKEGIITVEAPNAALRAVAATEGCEKLTTRKMNSVRNGYPPPKLKQKYRLRSQMPDDGEVDPTAGPYEVDDEGNRIIDTFQTVRSGYYLIDVPVIGTN